MFQSPRDYFTLVFKYLHGMSQISKPYVQIRFVIVDQVIWLFYVQFFGPENISSDTVGFEGWASP